MRSTIAVAMLLLAGVAHGDVLEIEGILCRSNRSVDRLIVDDGVTRHPVTLDGSTRVSIEGHRLERGALRPGDLLEIRGTWTKEREIRASSIHVITDDEPDTCRDRARKPEPGKDTASREAAERRFLDGHDPDEE